MSVTTIPAATPTTDAAKTTVSMDLPNATLSERQSATPKTTEATPPAPATEDKAFSEKFAVLSKKEKALLRERQEAKALKASLLQQQQALEAREQRLKQFESLQGASPLERLKFLGTDYNELTQYYLNNGAPTPEIQVQSVKKELEDFKRQQEEQSKKQIEMQKLQAEQELNEVLTQFKGEIGSFVSGKKEEYELINHFEQSSLVYDTIQKYFEDNSKVLSIKEASDLVERYLEDQIRKTAATKKFSKLITPEAPKEQKSPPQQSPSNQSRTLSNNLTPSMSSVLPASSERQRMERAMAKLGD